jgi:hypothetical protein
MAKRKKNAGQGYGMQFHGAFGSKTDAKKKERAVHGFIQPRTIRGKRRFVVMSERKNPRKKTSRGNPVRYDEGAGKYVADKITEEFGRVYGSGDTKKQALKDLRDRLRRYRKGIGVKRTPYGVETEPGAGYPWDRGNPSELVVMGANPSKATPQEIVLEPGRSYTIRSNPSAEAIRESFTGMRSEGYTVYDMPGMPEGEYAQLGELLSLYVKPLIGGQVREIRFKAPRPLLISDTSARQLYFVNGDQDITDGLHLFNSATQRGGMVELGEVRMIAYKQRKEHVPRPDLDEWQHRFGEESGEKPTLWFDRELGRLFLKGGDYTVRPEGITN